MGFLNQKCFKPYTSCSQLLGFVPCQLLLLVFCFYTITNCLLRLRFVINDDVQLLDRTWTKSRNMTARRSGKTEERVHGEEKRSCICFWLVHTTIYRLYTFSEWCSLYFSRHAWSTPVSALYNYEPMWAQCDVLESTCIIIALCFFVIWYNCLLALLTFNSIVINSILS